MDAVERLPLESAQENVAIGCERRHRYEFAAALLGGLRVLDLGCGSGDGTEILAGVCAHVTGVDPDLAEIELAAATVGRRYDNVTFKPAPALSCLRGDVAASFDAVVCFSGMGRPPGLEGVAVRLGELAQAGVRILASVANDAVEDAVTAFRGLPNLVVVPQFLAGGSLILPAEATETDVQLTLGDRYEPEYANHLLFLVGFSEEAVRRVHHGRMQLSAAPAFNRGLQSLEHAVSSLRRENARLARQWLSQGGSAAATALRRVADSDERVAGLRHLLGEAEQRILELEAELGQREPVLDEGQPAAAAAGPHTEAVEATPLPPDPGGDPNSWEQRRRRAAEYLIPWVEKTVPLEGKTVLEYGCGNAAVSAAFAARADRVIGVDIDAGWIERGREELRRRQVKNVELHLHPAETIVEATSEYRGQVDVFLLYAVLEHLTIDERLAVLRLAREVVRPDGAIVVCEAPNRLIYFDHHTAQMPFFHLLEPELALRYGDRSPRADLREALAEAVREGEPAAELALTRLGRGVSFHEFELVFGDLSRHVIASSYDPALFGERPIHPDEVILARYLDRLRPDLAPAWSRYWLDLILSPQPVTRRPPFLRPWTAETTGSRGVGWTAQENLHLPGPGGTLWVDLPHATTRLVVGSLTQDGHWFVLEARAEGAQEALTSGHMARPRHAAFSTFNFEPPVKRVALSASSECHIVFVGYDD